MSPGRSSRRPTLDNERDDAPQRAYVVTLVVYQHATLLGEVAGDRVALSDLGEAVARSWEVLPSCVAGVETDACVLMPNHLHGVVFLPAQGDITLDLAMRAFKSLSTLSCNNLLERAGGRFWQPGYESYPIRSDQELRQVFEYLDDDPRHWADDEYNPAHSPAGA